MKSSIKRRYSEVNEDIRVGIPSMREDGNGNVEYVITVEGEEKHFTPFHLAGTVIADRVEDIKRNRKTETLNLVLSVVCVLIC